MPGRYADKDAAMAPNEVVYVVDVRTPEGEEHYVTLIPPAKAFSAGLTREAIVGKLLPPWVPGKPFVPEMFVPNAAFLQVMHEVIARVSPGLPSCRAEARRIGDGVLYVIDQRTPTPDDGVPPEDIVGAFEVKGGEVTKESYRPNPNHLILAARGFFQLDAGVREHLVRELETRNRGAS